MSSINFNKRQTVQDMLRTLLSKDPESLYAKCVNEEIGYGLFTKDHISLGDFIAHYRGEMIPAEEADKRKHFGYLFYFIHTDHRLCVDAFNENSVARYANDDWHKPNARVCKMVVDGHPHLFLRCIREIHHQEEIRYDYGDKSAPWRKKNKQVNASRKRKMDNEGLTHPEQPDIVDYDCDNILINCSSAEKCDGGAPVSVQSTNVSEKSVTETTCMDSTVLPDKDYEYRLIAVNEVESSKPNSLCGPIIIKSPKEGLTPPEQPDMVVYNCDNIAINCSSAEKGDGGAPVSVQWTDVSEKSVTETTCMDSTVLPDKDYEYRLIAVNEVVSSKPSSLCGPIIIKSPKEGLTLTEQPDMVVYDCDNIAINCSSAEKGDGGAPVSVQWTDVSEKSVTETTCMDSTVLPDKDYEYRLIAVNEVESSKPSFLCGPIIIKSPKEGLIPPEQPDMVVYDCDNIAINCSSAEKGDGGAPVSVQWTDVSEKSVTETTCMDSTVFPDKDYEYRLIAVNEVESSKPSSLCGPIIIKSPKEGLIPPEQPDMVVYDCDNIAINCSSAEKGDGGAPVSVQWTDVSEKSVTETTCMDSTVFPDKDYEYRLIAVNEVESSKPSSLCGPIIIKSPKEGLTHPEQPDMLDYDCDNIAINCSSAEKGDGGAPVPVQWTDVSEKSVTETTCMDSTVLPDKDYEYRLIAVIEVESSKPSSLCGPIIIKSPKERLTHPEQPDMVDYDCDNIAINCSSAEKGDGDAPVSVQWTNVSDKSVKETAWMDNSVLPDNDCGYFVNAVIEAESPMPSSPCKPTVISPKDVDVPTLDSANDSSECIPNKIQDILHPAVHMTPIQTSLFKASNMQMKKNKRVFNKSSACLYCSNIVTNISRHYSIAHKNESRVTQILARKENANDTKHQINNEWELLRNEGNHKHNKEVISSKTGELLVVRRRHDATFSSDDYTPCPHCFGWYYNSGPALYIHVNYRCVARKEENATSSNIMSKSAIHRSTETIDKLDSTVFLTMRNDSIKEIARKDKIIRKIGEFYLAKHCRNPLRCKNFSSKHMRAAATLLQTAREIESCEEDLDYFLTAQKFHVIQTAAIRQAGSPDGTYTTVSYPSTLKNIGYDIKHLAEIKQEIAICAQDKDKMDEAKFFLKLYKSKWKLLAHSGQKQLEERTFNRELKLPTEPELTSVITYIKKGLHELKTKDYKDVVRLVQARLTMFNMRRPGELEALRLEDFHKRRNNDTVLSDAIMGTLTELERLLLHSHQMVTVRGKRGHGVPILIPADCLDAMLLLADSDTRKTAGIKRSNCYLFANTGDGVFRAIASLKEVLARCSSKLDTAHIKATTLRKYLATNCQLMNLSDSELQWIVNHLGHTKLTHLNSYRLPSSTIERTKMAKLLVLLENGLISAAQGNNLSNKDLDDMILKSIKMNCDEDYADQKETEDSDESTMTEDANEEVTDSEDANDESNRKEDDASSSDDNDLYEEVPRSTGRKYRIWQEEGVLALKREFKVELSRKIYPSFAAIRAVISKYPLYLADRSAAQVKSKLSHMMKQ